jgi:hypothetical protein
VQRCSARPPAPIDRARALLLQQGLLAPPHEPESHCELKREMEVVDEQAIHMGIYASSVAGVYIYRQQG